MFVERADIPIRESMRKQVHQFLACGAKYIASLSKSIGIAHDPSVIAMSKGNSKLYPTLDEFLPEASGTDEVMLRCMNESPDSSAGPIQIETDVGLYVSLKNTSKEAMKIGGWTLRQTTKDSSVDFHFAKGVTMKPGEKITIWSASAGAKHHPPQSVVMKSKIWPNGETVRTALLDGEKKEIVARETTGGTPSSLNDRPEMGRNATRKNGHGKDCAVM